MLRAVINLGGHLVRFVSLYFNEEFHERWHNNVKEVKLNDSLLL